MYCPFNNLQDYLTCNAFFLAAAENEASSSSFSYAPGDIQTIANRCGNICTAVLDLTDSKKCETILLPHF